MAAEQNYQSHRHRPVLTLIVWGLALLALVWFVVPALRHWSLVPGLVLLTITVAMLAYVTRGYALRLQDRIIRLEMQTRCRDLLGAERARALTRLTKRQVIALRFASDEELPLLMDRAEKDSLSADEIKRAIKNWRPDWDRT